MRVLALDFGSARTGVAVSDETGTLARPVGVVERAAGDAGLARLAELVAAEEAELVVVGLPLTLRGERGAQAEETEAFVEALRTRLSVPVGLGAYPKVRVETERADPAPCPGRHPVRADSRSTI